MTQAIGAYFARLERGIENPTVAVLDKIAKAVREPIAELFTAVGARTAVVNLKGGRP